MKLSWQSICVLYEHLMPDFFSGFFRHIIKFKSCARYETYISGQEPSLNLTLEHVLPYTPDDAWQASFGRDNHISAIDRLGNMALLPKQQNMSQEPFPEKQTRLRNSPYHINQHIAEYDSWNIEHVHDHQKWLAAQATAVWQIAS